MYKTAWGFQTQLGSLARAAMVWSVIVKPLRLARRRLAFQHHDYEERINLASLPQEIYEMVELKAAQEYHDLLLGSTLHRIEGHCPDFCCEKDNHFWVWVSAGFRKGAKSYDAERAASVCDALRDFLNDFGLVVADMPSLNDIKTVTMDPRGRILIILIEKTLELHHDERSALHLPFEMQCLSPHQFQHFLDLFGFHRTIDSSGLLSWPFRPPKTIPSPPLNWYAISVSTNNIESITMEKSYSQIKKQLFQKILTTDNEEATPTVGKEIGKVDAYSQTILSLTR